MKDTGGSAFPRPASNDDHSQPCNHFDDQVGMTLRDYFAAKALAALIGHQGKDGSNRGPSAVPTLAKFAYEYADAMLEARNQQ